MIELGLGGRHMKKTIAVSLSLLFLLSGCGSTNEPKEVMDENKIDIHDQTSGNGAREYLKYNVKSDSFAVNRGLITETINNKIDMDEIETGLMTLSKEFFSPDTFLYEEGQFLTDVTSWIGRKSADNQQGLNPEIKVTDDMGWEKKMEIQKKNPMYLAYIHEQNYVDTKGNIKGISLGLAMNTIDYIRVQDSQGLMHFGEVRIDKKEMEKQGREMAEKVISRVRKIEGLGNIPIMISLYNVQEQNSVIPGNYYAYSFVKENENKIKNWEQVNQQYYYFPSDAGEKKDRDMAERLLNLEDYVNQYFTNQDIDFVGKALYEEEDITKLVIEVSSEMIKSPEIIGFSQAIVPELVDYFPHTPAYVYVKTPKGIKATIIKEEDQEPFVHIHEDN
jgi:protein involved in sex pheromone biosynthesis